MAESLAVRSFIKTSRGDLRILALALAIAGGTYLAATTLKADDKLVGTVTGLVGFGLAFAEHL